MRSTTAASGKAAAACSKRLTKFRRRRLRLAALPVETFQGIEHRHPYSARLRPLGRCLRCASHCCTRLELAQVPSEIGERSHEEGNRGRAHQVAHGEKHERAECDTPRFGEPGARLERHRPAPRIETGANIIGSPLLHPGHCEVRNLNRHGRQPEA